MLTLIELPMLDGNQVQLLPRDFTNQIIFSSLTPNSDVLLVTKETMILMDSYGRPKPL